MKLHIIYIPGLGDGYDFIRRVGLLSWRRRDVSVTLVPMRWSDKDETFEDKLDRIKQAIDSKPVPAVLVGESAGGAMAIAVAAQFPTKVIHTITLCGMNQGAGSVGAHLYRKNPAFREAMTQADKVTANRSDADASKMTILYSSRDSTVRPKDTLIANVTAIDLKTPGHMPTILTVLYLRSRFVLSLMPR
jgi:pimeloyl-ACP methyl ester carboxylesterase